VCNPATGQLVTFPVYPTHAKPYEKMKISGIYLIFDPAISSHFHLVEFWEKSCLEVHIYSSEPGRGVVGYVTG
jgi:hypothetical protein